MVGGVEFGYSVIKAARADPAKPAASGALHCLMDKGGSAGRGAGPPIREDTQKVNVVDASYGCALPDTRTVGSYKPTHSSTMYMGRCLTSR